MPNPAAFLNSLEDLYRKNTKPPRMILISFPHNPTTQCVDHDFFKEIIRMASHHGTMVLHDFAYADIGFDGYKPPSILEVDGAISVLKYDDVPEQLRPQKRLKFLHRH
jgi:alanine-synthesizing transaminase